MILLMSTVIGKDSIHGHGKNVPYCFLFQYRYSEGIRRAENFYSIC